jgi:carbon monoxide dehydrogenase subunit G
MIDIDHSVTIDRPLEEVWDFVSDPANNPQWQSGVTQSDQSPVGPVGVGTRVRIIRRFMGQRMEVVFETTEFAPNEKFAFKSLSGPLDVSGFLAVSAIDAGTEVTYHGTGKAKGVLGLGETIIAGLVNRQVNDDLKALKMLLESG